VKSTVKEATEDVVDTVKDVVEVGKIVGEKVKGYSPVTQKPKGILM
jgi:hypothetical protein